MLKNSNRRNFIQQNRQSVNAMSKMLSPIIKSKYQGNDYKQRPDKLDVDDNQNEHFLTANKSILKNQLRCSGNLDNMSASLDAWSLSN